MLSETELKIIGGAIGAVLLGGQFIYNRVTARRAKRIEDATESTKTETFSQTDLMNKTLTTVNEVATGMLSLHAKVDSHHIATQGELGIVRKTAEDALALGKSAERRLDLIETRRGDKTMSTPPTPNPAPIPDLKPLSERDTPPMGVPLPRREGD